MRKLTHMQRAERWYRQQVKSKNLRDADYSSLTRRLPICYEPATLLTERQNVTKHDILSAAKALKAITDFKL